MIIIVYKFKYCVPFVFVILVHISVMGMVKKFLYFKAMH